MISPERFASGQPFDEFLASVEQNADLWRAVAARARVPSYYVERLRATGARWHLAILSEDWCGDAVNTVPIVARVAALAGNADARLFGRDASPDLMDAHLTGTSRSIPVVIVLDEEWRERGWWGPRPSELQRWALGPGRTLDKTARYRELRRWYARDQGASTLEEIVALIERAAGLRKAEQAA